MQQGKKHRKADAFRAFLTQLRLKYTRQNHIVFDSLLLISELTRQKIKVIFCDERRNPSSELMSFYGCHNCSLTLKKQLDWQEDSKKLIWTRIVAEKIRCQANNLIYFGLTEAELLYRYIDELEFNDESNREGHAAKVYFNSLFGKNFLRDDVCPVNAALNYGYSVILSCFNREVVSNGCLTQLGLFHDNMFNQFNLSCDIMEPFRPIIDRCVRLLSPEKFELEEKRELLTVLSDEFIIDGRKQTLLNTIKIYTKSVLEAVEQGDASCIKMYRYEL